MNEINKIGLVIIQDKKVLLVRKKNTDKLIIPGGKIRPNEEYSVNLRREIQEELSTGINLKSLKYLDYFEEKAEFESNHLLKMHLYQGELMAEPLASSEIEEIVWFGKNDDFSKLSNVLKKLIIPYLINKKLI